MSTPKRLSGSDLILHWPGCPGEDGILDLCECTPVVVYAPSACTKRAKLADDFDAARAEGKG